MLDLVYKIFLQESSQSKFYRQWPFKVASFCQNAYTWIDIFHIYKIKDLEAHFYRSGTSARFGRIADAEKLKMYLSFWSERNGVQKPYFNNYQTLICPSYISFILFLIFNWNSVLFFFLVIYIGSAQSVNIIKSMDLVLTSHNFDISRK